MKKPDIKRERGRGFFSDEDHLGASARKKSLKPSKTAKKIRWQDIDDFDE